MPAVCVYADASFDPQGLQNTENDGELTALGRDADRGALRGSPGPGHWSPRGRVGQLTVKSLQELEAAARSTDGIHGHSCSGELVDIAQNRARADVKLTGELGRGRPAAALENQHQREQSAGTHPGSLASGPYS